MAELTRRKLLAGSGALAGAGLLHRAVPHGHPWEHEARADTLQHAGHDAEGGHASFRDGQTVDHAANGFDPHAIVRDFDWGTTHKLASGRVVREWELFARRQGDRGRAGRAASPPGRTTGGSRARRCAAARASACGSRSSTARSTRTRSTSTASTRLRWTACPASAPARSRPGGKTVYEFDALPAGLHLYHCHSRPLAEHITKGLYGAFIIDPADAREDADELVMVMNGFDTNFDRANEMYAANSIPFAYMDTPIQVARDALVRIYLVNVLEYDLINSFHLHGNLFNYFPTGTSKTPSEFTDTVMLCQGQRGILEWRFAHPGKFMFHAHQSEFTELGWQGFFEVS